MDYLQVVPVAKISSDILREAFLSHGQLQGIEFTELPPGTSVVDVSRSLLSHNSALYKYKFTM